MRRIFHFVKHHKLISIVIIIIIFGLGYYFRPKQTPSLATQKVIIGDIIESLSATGNIDSSNSVDLNFMLGGKVTFLSVKKGDTVQAGQVIASLDQRTIQKNLETSLRNYSVQRNTFDQTKDNNQNRTPDGALNDNMKRILQNNQYDLEKAVLSVELQDLARDQAVITSPITGIVTRADITTAGVNIGPTKIFTIADPTNLLFKVEIDEADIGKVRVGEPMKITLDAYPNETIDAIVNSIDFATHTTSTGGDAFNVEASLPANNGLTYRIGMNGDAEIIADEVKDILTIPLSSIVDDKYVFVKTPTIFEKRDVVLGLKNDTDAEVKEGLKSGEEVAIDPSLAEKSSNIIISPTP